MPRKNKPRTKPQAKKPKAKKKRLAVVELERGRRAIYHGPAVNWNV